MKISLCLHMERTSAEETHRQLYDEFIYLCTIADKGGFHTIWTGEHHGMEFSITPNPLLLLADLASKTKNVRLGTATLIAPFWHPIKLAGEIALTDVITNGRLDVGISKGAYTYEYDRLKPGADVVSSGEMMREMIPAIINLWKGDYSHSGKHWKFPSSISAPLPIQKPHPPIWIACQHPYTFKFALENGCNIQVAPLWNGDNEVENLMNVFKTTRESHPEIKRPKIMILRHTFVAETEDELVRASEDLSNFYCEFSTWFKNERTVKNGVLKPLSKAEKDKMDIFSAEKLRKNLMIGTPNEIINRLKRYEALGYDEYSVWIANGMSFEAKKTLLNLLIDKVIPVFNK